MADGIESGTVDDEVKPAIAFLFGANLNTLGRRLSEHYGQMTLDEVIERLQNHAKKLDVRLETFQSNFEGEMMNWVHTNRENIDGYIINPGGFTMYGQGFRDAILDTERPLVEVHWSNIHARGIESIWSKAAVGQICGFHWRGALIALDVLADLLRGANFVGPLDSES